VALFFVIFDLEAVFLFAWAIAARELGWSGYVGMLIFMGVLAAALFYEWRLGVLDGWGRAALNEAALRRRSRGERAALNEAALRRRSRGERAAR
jgi:NADH-quinone oxidoreductase subunit A